MHAKNLLKVGQKMKIYEHTVILNENRRSGVISIHYKTFEFEIYGLSGQGYNIKVSGLSDDAVLQYNEKDGPGASVKFGKRSFRMTETEAVELDEGVIMSLNKDGSIVSIADDLIIAIFILNHYFALKTGPWQSQFQGSNFKSNGLLI